MFRLLKDDVMVQFTVTALVLMVLLAGLTSAVLSSTLDRQSDIMSGVVGGGFILVYGGLVAIVWRARNTIMTQKGFESLNSELNKQIQAKTAELQRTVDQLAEEAAERERSDEALREVFSAYVRQITDNKRLEGGDGPHSQELEAMVKMANILTQPGSFSQKAHRVLADLGQSNPVRSNGASTENWRVANLEGANLGGANLQHSVGLSWQQVKSATFYDGTVLPDYLLASMPDGPIYKDPRLSLTGSGPYWHRTLRVDRDVGGYYKFRRGDKVIINSERYKGVSGGVDSAVFQRTADYPDQYVPCYHFIPTLGRRTLSRGSRCGGTS